MKKILSLLSLLVMTLTAFATDYTGHRTVTYGSNERKRIRDASIYMSKKYRSSFYS